MNIAVLTYNSLQFTIFQKRKNSIFWFIGLYARNKLRYDRFNENFDRIYRLEFGNRVGQPTAPGHQIKQYFSEVENVVRLVTWEGKDESLLLSYFPEGDSTEINHVKVNDFFWCDSSIFTIVIAVLFPGR